MALFRKKKIDTKEIGRKTGRYIAAQKQEAKEKTKIYHSWR